MLKDNRNPLTKELKEYVETRRGKGAWTGEGKIISIRFPAELWEEVCEHSKRRHCSINAAVRHLVDCQIRFLKQGDLTEAQKAILCGIDAEGAEWQEMRFHTAEKWKEELAKEKKKQEREAEKKRQQEEERKRFEAGCTRYFIMTDGEGYWARVEKGTGEVETMPEEDTISEAMLHLPIMPWMKPHEREGGEEGPIVCFFAHDEKGNPIVEGELYVPTEEK